MKEISLDITYHKNQQKIFFESNARYKVIAKGRRFGLTRGFANYVIDQMMDGVSPVLWVDTIYGNIDRYVERYFTPTLKQLPKNLWKYRSNRNDLKIMSSVCDFRSADRPENIEGFGYALIIINEAGIVLKNRSLWNESIRPMILDYKADVLIGGTPKGKNVKGKREKHLFYELFERGGQPTPSVRRQGGELVRKNEWESFNFSSYDNPLIDKNEIDELVKEISPALRDQEVFGKFVDKETSGIIKSEWWRYYNPEYITQKRILKKIQSWDTAFKDKEGNDFSVCTTWFITPDGFYLVNLWKDRVEFPELKKKCKELYKLYNLNEVLVEDKASGQSLIQEMKRGSRIPIKAIKVDTDKIARVHSVTPLIEAGKVYLPEGEIWVKDFIDECEEFPDGEFDDAVDSLSQFLNYAKDEKRIISNEPVIHLPRKQFRTKYRKYQGRVG